MIVTLTKRELETINKRKEKASQKYDEARARARSLRPDPEPPPYPKLPDRPKDKESDEYAKYTELVKEANEKNFEAYQAWYESGSREWQIAYGELGALTHEKSNSFSDILKKADDRLLKRITKSPEATIKALKAQVDTFLSSELTYLEDGSSGFEIATDTIKDQLQSAFYKPLQTLNDEARAQIADYIDQKLSKLPPKVLSYNPTFVTMYGTETPIELDGKIVYYSISYLIPSEESPRKKAEEERHTATAPKNYVTTVDRITKKAFDDRLTKPLNADKDAYFDVDISSRNTRKEVIARVAIDYQELVESGVFQGKPPALGGDDYNVLDAIHSEIVAGNYAFTKTMLYRVMTGKMQGYLEVPEDISNIIDDALLKFKGLLKTEYSEVDKEGNLREIKLDEPIVTYIRGKGYLNGEYVDDLIVVPKDDRFTPPFLKWARFNNNEIDSRDVTLLDVKGLNNGKESRTIKMCLYRRVIEMRNKYERAYRSKRELPDNQRSIRYDYVYKALELKEPDKNKRRLIKSKIDRCMKFWESKGLIEGYRHKKDNSGTYYAVEVSFMPSSK